MARKGDKSQFWSHEFIWNSQTFWIRRLKSSRPPWKFQRWDLDRLKKESHQDFFFQCSNPMKINLISSSFKLCPPSKSSWVMTMWCVGGMSEEISFLIDLIFLITYALTSHGRFQGLMIPCLNKAYLLPS